MDEEDEENITLTLKEKEWVRKKVKNAEFWETFGNFGWRVSKVVGGLVAFYLALKVAGAELLTGVKAVLGLGDAPK